MQPAQTKPAATRPAASLARKGARTVAVIAAAGTVRRDPREGSPEALPDLPVVPPGMGVDPLGRQRARQQAVGAVETVRSAPAEVQRDLLFARQPGRQPTPQFAADIAVIDSIRGPPAGRPTRCRDLVDHFLRAEVGGQDEHARQVLWVVFQVEQAADPPERAADRPDRVVPGSARRHHDVEAQTLDHRSVPVVAEMGIDRHQIEGQTPRRHGARETGLGELLGSVQSPRQEHRETPGSHPP